MSSADIQALWLTLKLAFVTTMLLMLLGTPIAWWLARTTNRCKVFIEAVVALPLVLPPTVLGFYLLVAMSPTSALGQSLSYLGLPSLVFSFKGLVIGSMIYSMPFVIQPLQQSFEKIGNAPLETARWLGIKPLSLWCRILLPMSRKGYFNALVLGFAHTLGEFGVVLMIGGNIPGETKVVSIAIFEHVESLSFASAHQLSVILLGISLLSLMLLYWTNGRMRT